MGYRETIETALSDIGAPVSFSHYSGSVRPYVTYFCYNDQGELFGEGEEMATGYSLQIDIYSDLKDTQTLANKITAALKLMEIKRNFSGDLPYEDATKLYHKSMRFLYTID